MKKIINNIKTYFEYRKNRRYVKMEMMKYKVEVLKFINDFIENKGDVKLGDNKLNDFKKNWSELVTILNQAAQAKKGE